jgi:N-acetylmuramoyl-L-alanine amidase
MGRKILKAAILFVVTICLVLVIPVYAQKKLLSVTHPPNNYRTKADKIFFIGTAPNQGEVTINGQKIDRSTSGNFAPTLALKEGDNTFQIRYQNEQIQLQVIREKVLATTPAKSLQEEGFEPRYRVSSNVGETLCASSQAPENSPVLAKTTNSSEPQAIYGAGQYLGCAVAKATGAETQPTARREAQAQPTALIQKSLAPTKMESLPTANLEVAEVVVNSAVARTGPNSNYSRVTPLPKGTKATVVGRQDGDNNGKLASFVHLDYGGWLIATDLKTTSGATVAPKSLLSAVRSQNRDGRTELRFPLEVAVPISIEQQEKSLKLTLYNTTAQTDAVKIGSDPVIDRVDWKARPPSQVEYTFTFKSGQQWGYKYHYEGNTLVLALRHPPKLNRSSTKPLTGTRILIDPGHGGTDSGAVGPNGYAEKEATLFAAKLLGNELVAKGAQVYLSRESDLTVSLDDRQTLVEKLEPTVSLSIHYNSLPDGADPIKSKGFSTYWYHSQAQGLANFLHTYVVQYGSRPRYGVTWDNLALARPAAAPAVLLELGFMSNPDEFEWITNPEAQQQMSKVLANGITQWLLTVS